MIRKINRKLEVHGASGNVYSLEMYSFDDFAELKTFFNPVSAIYVFTRRFWSYVSAEYQNELIYCGETEDLSTRFDNHHAEDCIVRSGANCISILRVEGEKQRRNVEKDILYNKFACNIQHQ